MTTQHRIVNGTLILLLTSVAATGGCSLFAKPDATITRLRLQDIALDSVTLLFDVDVKNPYALPLPLLNLDYGLASGDAKFLTGAADLQTTIPALSTRTVQLPAKIKYLDLLKALKGVKPGQILPFKADLGLSVDIPGGKALRLPLTKEGELPIPAAPDVRVTDIKWDTLTLDHAGGTIRLVMKNNNEFPIELSKLAYGLKLAGVQVADSSLAKALALQPGATGELAIPLSLSPKKLGSAAFGVLTGKGANYDLGGSVDLKTPFGPMKLTMTGKGAATMWKP